MTSLLVIDDGALEPILHGIDLVEFDHATVAPPAVGDALLVILQCQLDLGLDSVVPLDRLLAGVGA